MNDFGQMMQQYVATKYQTLQLYLATRILQSCTPLIECKMTYHTSTVLSFPKYVVNNINRD